MFGLGMPELILILVIVLVLFGAKNLPDIGKAFGKTIHEFRNATSSEPEKTESEKKEISESEKDRTTKK
jgi:sec-independent protein translocase protein TatA